MMDTKVMAEEARKGTKNFPLYMSWEEDGDVVVIRATSFSYLGNEPKFTGDLSESGRQGIRFVRETGKRYEAIYSGDTGVDNGLFSAGLFDTVEEARVAAMAGYNSCTAYAITWQVVDRRNRQVVASKPY